MKFHQKKWELVNFCEFDKYAEKSYCDIHGVDNSLNLGDITKVNEKNLKDFDMMTWGFPCTDISLAGKQKGFIDNEGNKTRSGMYYEGIRILREKKPKFSIIENVKNLTSKKFKNEFDMVLDDLNEAGYNNYWKVLNSKNYGIPQNRERVFIVSIRKDVDNGLFQFPQPFELKLKLKDMLEENVNEKYYLSEKMINGFLKHNQKHEGKGTGFIWKTRDLDGCASTLRANGALAATDNTINVVRKYGVFDSDKSQHQAGSVYDENGISPTLDTMQGGYRQPCVEVQERECIMIPEKTKKGYKEAFEGDDVYIDRPHQKRGCVQRDMIQTLKTSGNDMGVIVGSTQKHAAVSKDGVCPTLTSAMGTGGGHVPMHNYDLRIRRLTPRECFRLMGFKDSDFDKIKGISNTQLYKQAGNSIVVDVLYYIYIELYKAMPYLFDNLKVSSFFSGIGAFEVALDRLYREVINKVE